jgi:hypothetical protein
MKVKKPVRVQCPASMLTVTPKNGAVSVVIVAGGFGAIVDPGACGAAGADFRRASARQSESRKYVKKANPICVARRAKAAEVSRRCVAR